MIINETLAKQYFPGVDPMGRRLKIGGPERPNNTWNIVVGVVGDINYSGLDAPPEPVVYYPFRQATSNNQYVVIRTSLNPRSLEPAVKAVVADLDKDVPVVNAPHDGRVDDGSGRATAVPDDSRLDVRDRGSDCSRRSASTASWRTR